LFFLLHSLNQYAWLRDSEGLNEGIRLVGSIMIVFGGVMALAQVRISKMMAYAILANYGIAILAVGAGTSAGYRLAIGHTGARVISFSLWGLGINLISRVEGVDSAEKLQGSFWRYPYVSSAALVGLFSASGLPLTAGFPGRWAIMTMLAPISGIAAGAALLGTAAIGLGGLRWLITMVQAKEARRTYLGLVERGFLVAGVGLCLAMGLFPQLTYPLVVQAAGGLANLIP
jgi:formate hydrogenlyase subunit 3/multisubunit Na+/H+ antiporter MnhD subunit